MRPTVADTTSIPAHSWRRHSDPPGLWVAVVIGSVALHLLAFWLIRSYQSSLLWREQSRDAIPVDVVEISAPKKSETRTSTRTKPASLKSSTTTQTLPKQVVPTQKLTVKPAPVAEDESAIALAQKRQQELAQQRQRQLAQQRQRELAQQRQQELAQQRQQELAQQRLRELEEQRLRELEEQRLRELNEKRQRELAQQRQRELDEQSQRENIGNNNNQEPLPPPSNGTGDATGGSLIASVVGEPQQGERDRHTNPAKIKPSNQPFTKGLEYVKFIERDAGKPVDLTVILTISEKGKLENVAIADAGISAQEKSYYQDFVTNAVLKGWEFEPAYDNDPKDPKPSNLTVRIRIQPLP